MTVRDRALMLAACVITSFTATVAVNLYFRGTAVAEDPKASDTIRVKRLEVVDGDGTMKMVLSTGRGGVPVIAMVDGDNNVRYSIALNKDGSGAQAFSDAKGRTRVALAMNPDGSGALIFSDEKGGTPIALAAGEKGAGLNLSDGRNVVRAALGVDSDGTPSLRWYGADGAEVKPK